MKKISLLIVLFLYSSVFAEEKIGDTFQSGSNMYMLVNIFNDAARFDEFQKNVEILKRENAILKEEIKKLALVKDDAEKKELQNKVKELEDSMEASEALMLRYYHFSTKRQYRFVFEETKLCVPLTDDEVTNLKSSTGVELDAEKIIEKDGKKLYVCSEISGIKENEKFQRALNFPMMRANEIAKLREELSKESDIVKKADISEKIVLAENALKEAQELLRKDYNLDSSKNSSMEVEKVRLYLLLTPEEQIKLKIDKKK